MKSILHLIIQQDKNIMFHMENPSGVTFLDLLFLLRIRIKVGSLCLDECLSYGEC